MKRKLRRMFIPLLALTLIFSTASMCSALEEVYEGEEELLENILLSEDMIEDGYPVTRSIGIMCTSSFIKTSSTRARAIIACECSMRVKSITSTMTLQVYSSSSKNYVNTSASPAVQTVKNSTRIGHEAVFKVADGKKYRIKIVIKALTDEEPTTETFYKNLA